MTIPDFGGGISEMEAMDVTADGLIMVGYGNNKRGPLAFRADMTDPLLPVVKTLTITDSVYTAQTLQWTRAEAVSADGLIIAGYGGTKTGNRAFVTHGPRRRPPTRSRSRAWSCPSSAAASSPRPMR